MKTMERKSLFAVCVMVFLMLAASTMNAKVKDIPVMETGGQPMPNEWIDKDTGHRVMKLTRREGSNRSFYFHNNPFINPKEMVFVGTDVKQASTDMRHNSTAGTVKQMYAVDLKSLKIRQITNEKYGVSTEIVCPKTQEIFFQHGDSIFCVSAKRGKSGTKRLIATMPKGRSGGIACVNCDGTRLAGTFNNPEEGRILREHPKKSEFFNLIYEARLEKTIFVIDVATGTFENVWTDNAWLNHLQFSPSDPNRLLFCHEGPWHKVDRIWNIDVRNAEELAAAGLSGKAVRQPVLMHKRTLFIDEYVDAQGKRHYGEIAGHEWFGAKGKYLYFDLQKPRGETFFVGKVNLETLEEEDFELTRDEWAVHFTTSWDETFLVGDGGSPSSVAHSNKDQWIYRYDYQKDANGNLSHTLRTEKLVNMKNHDYSLEPNVHMSPDQKWVIFRANFEGYDNIYAVELKK